MGDTTENLSQGVNVTFEVDNENSDVSRNIPPNPTCTPAKSAKEIILTLSDKLYRDS